MVIINFLRIVRDVFVEARAMERKYARRYRVYE